MKQLRISLLAAIVGITFLSFAGSTPSSGTINTSALQKAFQNASSLDKAEVQNAITAIRSHDYPTAMTSLGKVASSANLTPQQKSAVQDTLNQVKSDQMGAAQKALGGSGDLENQAGQGAGKAAEQLNKALNPK